MEEDLEPGQETNLESLVEEGKWALGAVYKLETNFMINKWQIMLKNV